MNRTGTARRSAPVALRIRAARSGDDTAETEHRGLTARELIRMAQAARSTRDDAIPATSDATQACRGDN
ncbi:hypothetical protein [uncultured Methylobacterium sp.]|uniref:hypothetical protein n=1 Tax=uncultured Methylobacterium sp. TaxID=157278 RepID=UPI002621DF30|nr:hypothetical protein [uncultured Methylobacterium sp.]